MEDTNWTNRDGKGVRWLTDPQKQESDEEHLYFIVQNLVKKLTSLKVLQLGGRKALNMTPFG